MMAQLRRDFLVHAEADGQAIFNALGADEKELLWIEESNQRFYAYNHFVQHPERLLGWFAKHMGPTSVRPCAGVKASAVAELGIRVALKAQFIGAMFGGEHAAYPDFYQSAFSGADPNHFMQLCPYLRRKNPARDSFREHASSRAVPGVSPENMFGETTRRTNLQRSRRRPRTHC